MISNPSFRLVRRADDPAALAPEERKSGLRNRKLPETYRDPKRAAEFYRLDPSLESAINMALLVGAPLLVAGEPGTGKTQVAYYLGWYFGIEVFDFQVKSTSLAEHMRFEFDAVGWLREAHHPSKGKRREREDFLHRRVLWRAYDNPEPSVVLIDEIDKAPRDFPNDLLQELDRHEFSHPFSDQVIRARSNQPPIVIITSNGARKLPDAFLRRCIYHHIRLSEELIEQIVMARSGPKGDYPNLDTKFLTAAMERFTELRGRPKLHKAPSTAELLIWLSILSAHGTQLAEIDSGVPLDELPALGALLKDQSDWNQLA